MIGTDRIDRDAVPTQLHSAGPRQADHTVLGRDIGRQMGKASFGRL